MIPAALQPWIEEGLEVLRVALFHPTNDQQMVILTGIGFLIIVFGLSNFHYIGGAGTASLLVSLFATTLGIILLLALAAGMQLLLFPWLEVEGFLDPIANKKHNIPDVLQMDTKRIVIFSILMGGFSFFVVSPITAGMFRSNMFVSATAWVISLFIAGFMIYLGSLVFSMLDEENPPVLEEVQQLTDKIKERAREMELPSLPSKPAPSDETP